MRPRLLSLALTVAGPVATVAALVLAGGGCDWAGDRFQTCEDAFVDLVNGTQSHETIDLVADGEDPGPQTPLQPGQKRRVTYCLSKGDRRAFRVLRQGEVLARSTCVASQASYAGRTVEVRWGPGGLACSGW